MTRLWTQLLLRTTLALAVLCTMAAQAGVSASLQEREYPVKPEPGERLSTAVSRASTIRHEGRIFHGYTEWHVNWQFRWWENGDGSCRITSVDTRLTATITLPRLDGGTPGQQTEFARYLAALREHEMGHYRIGQDAAQAIDSAIRLLPQQPSCKVLEQTANAAGQQEITRHQEHERRYDVTTQHGRKDGAWIKD